MSRCLPRARVPLRWVGILRSTSVFPIPFHSSSIPSPVPLTPYAFPSPPCLSHFPLHFSTPWLLLFTYHALLSTRRPPSHPLPLSHPSIHHQLALDPQSRPTLIHLNAYTNTHFRNAVRLLSHGRGVTIHGNDDLRLTDCGNTIENGGALAAGATTCDMVRFFLIHSRFVVRR
jgi:hypothetical protein